MSVRRSMRKSTLLLKLLSELSFALTWLALSLEVLLRRFSDKSIRITSKLMNLNSTQSHRFYKFIGKRIMPDRLTDRIVKNLHTNDITLQTSLASAIFLRNAYSSGVILPEWKINDKITGRRFAEALGLNVPAVYQENVRFENISLKNNIVIKPVDAAAARGVFIIKSPNRIIELRTGLSFDSTESLREHAKLLLEQKNVQKDLWTVEEFIENEKGHVANDLKFYTFYGKVGWISEIQRQPIMLHNTIDRDGNPVDYGLYKNNEMFIGEGASLEEIEMIERISCDIPVPYIRIDFLRGKKGLIFCEFTPRSGITGTVNRDMDLKYGKLFYEAEARLYNDLISGKSFDVFNHITKIS